MSSSQNQIKPVGWGIIGIGSHVEARVAPAFLRSSKSKLVGVYSRSLERAQAFAVKYKSEKAFDSYEKMLADPAIEAIFVASPNNLHAEHTILAAQSGKHVLCEKPMALNENDCYQMIETCDKNQAKLGLVFQNRYHPAHVEARRLTEIGDVGEVSLAKAQYCNPFLRKVLQKGWRSEMSSSGGGALMGTGLHPVDLLRFLLGSEITEIRALCEPQPSEKKVDEIIYTILKFASGATGVVISGVLNSRSDNDAILYGNKARVTCKGTIGMPMEGELLVEGNSIDLRMSFPTDDPKSALYLKVIEAFNGSIRENTRPDIPGSEGLQMCRVANAIIESSRQGKAIKISK